MAIKKKKMMQHDSNEDIRIYVDNEMYTYISDDAHKWMDVKTITVQSPRKIMSFGYDPKPQIILDRITVYQKECIKHVEKSKTFFEIYYTSKPVPKNIDD